MSAADLGPGDDQKSRSNGDHSADRSEDRSEDLRTVRCAGRRGICHHAGHRRAVIAQAAMC